MKNYTTFGKGFQGLCLIFLKKMFVLFSACLIVFVNLLTEIINVVVVQFNIVDKMMGAMIFFYSKDNLYYSNIYNVYRISS
mgnify:CR=1 FL=1